MSDEEGEEMNKSVEQFFVKTYIDKDYQERLLFELNSIKKRSKALSRFSHDVESVFKKSVNKKIISNLDDFQEKDQTVYVISWDEKDGTTMSLSDAIRYLESSYMSAILIGKDFSLIKEEPEKGGAKYFILRVN